MAELSHIGRLLEKISEEGGKYIQGQSNKDDLLSTLRRAQREIEGPAQHLSNTRFLPLNNMCQLMAIEMGLLNAIVESVESISASQISLLIKQDRRLIVRIMRLLVASGICDETGPETYRSNAIAELLNTPGQTGATKNMVELMFPIAGHLAAQIRHPKGLGQFSDDANGMTPFEAAYGGRSMFEFLESNPEHKQAFDQFMGGRRTSIRRHWFETYDVEKCLFPGLKHGENSVLVVDVGGGRGHDITSFAERYPNIKGRCILQDLPHTLKGLGDKLGKVEVISHDFFTVQSIQGARAYFFRSILHDWSDAKCTEILLQTAKAMTRGYSKLLLEELIMPEMGASLRSSSIDVLMFMMPGGVERTLADFERLLSSAGLKIVKTWPGANGTESLMEAELL